MSFLPIIETSCDATEILEDKEWDSCVQVDHGINTDQASYIKSLRKDGWLVRVLRGGPKTICPACRKIAKITAEGEVKRRRL